MNTEFFGALEQLEAERGIKVDYMLERVSNALITAYKKDNIGIVENVFVEPNLETQEINMYAKKEVVDIVEDPITEVSLEDARLVSKKAEYGDIISIDIKTKDFGRIAAQTAKQVIIQAIREAERGMLTDKLTSQENEILNALVMRVDPQSKNVYVETTSKGEKVEGTLTIGEQVPGETLVEGQYTKVYLLEVKTGVKGPQMFISRTHPGLIKRLFEQEVPEINEGIVEIKMVVREAGSRTKIAVHSNDDMIDPVGACIGSMSARVLTVINEIGGEKIDIIKYSDDIQTYVSRALSPASVLACKIVDGKKACQVIVPDDELSLAIGKQGQNARLSARLTGCKIDIKPLSSVNLEEFKKEAMETKAMMEAIETIEEA